MLKNGIIASLLAASSLAMVATPAYAGKADRARTQIGAAQAKVDTAKSMGAAAELPRGVAEADAALKTAQEDFKAGHKSEAIEGAIHAQALADAAIGEMQKRKDMAAQQQQADAQAQTAAAQQQADAATQQANDANTRAAMAEQSAAHAAAEANAAKLAAAQQPTQVETTVTTQQATRAKPVTHAKVVKKTVKRSTATATAAPATTTTATTTVSSNM